jgi:uncharacterized protein (DUF58 family)
MLTRRGRLALLFGVVLYVVAWALGSKALYPVAVGLVGVAVAAALWIRLARRPIALDWGSRKREHVEGEDVQVEMAVALDTGLLPAPAAVLVQRIGRLGTHTTSLERDGDSLIARYVLEGVPRGRYVLEDARVVVEDPFGLERLEAPLPGGAALLVYPRLVELEGLFSDSGRGARDGVRILLHRPAGFDIHSVREYQEGDSLRRVHWPSTAKRGQLMIRELEDAPRDEVSVLLDASCPSVGAPPHSSFDVQVRAAGSLLLAQVRRGKRALLAVSGDSLRLARVSGADGDWLGALGLLAAAEPGGMLGAAAALAEGSPAAGPLETVVVTSRLTPALVDRLLQRLISQRRVSLVYVDAESFGLEGANGKEPALLRLQAAGVRVAILHRGDDLAGALGERPLQAAANA